MAEVKIEKIEVIVREHLDNDPFEKAIAEAHGVSPKGATVGVKIFAGGKFYGDYMVFKESTVSASVVAKSLNALFESVLKEVEKNG
jgi:hypothetical protein